MKPKTKNILRFIGLARVSTDSQLQGQSIPVQKDQIRGAVEQLGGQLVHIYEGSEHATAGHERKLLNQILDELEAGAGNALMVTDLSRLTRDPRMWIFVSDQLKACGASLYIGTLEVDLDDPQGEFSATVQAAVHRLEIRQFITRTLDSKLRMLNAGAHVVGRPPIGRKCAKVSNGKYEWLLDKTILKRAQRAYTLYVKREYSIKQVADAIDMAPSSLLKMFDQAGSSFSQSLTVRGTTHTKVATIPALLQDRQVAEIMARRKAQQIGGHRNPRMLSGLVRCKACGGTMSAMPNKGRRIYRHLSATFDKDKCCSLVDADLLEQSVLYACGLLIRDGKTLRAAIENALLFRGIKANETQQRYTEAKLAVVKKRKKLDRAVSALPELADTPNAKATLIKNVKKLESELIELQNHERNLSISMDSAKATETDLKVSQHAIQAYVGLNGGAPAALLALNEQRKLVRIVVGRNNRQSKNGIYVRGCKDERGWFESWDWDLLGEWAKLSDGVISPFAEIDRPADIEIVGEPDLKSVTGLAAIAKAADPHFTALLARPRYPYKRKTDMHTIMKSSSND